MESLPSVPNDKSEPPAPSPQNVTIDNSGYQTGNSPWALDGDGYPSPRPPGFDVLHPIMRPEPIQQPIGPRSDNDGNPFPPDPKVGQVWYFNGNKYYWNGTGWTLIVDGGGADTDDWVPPYVPNTSNSLSTTDGVPATADLDLTSFNNPDAVGYPRPDFTGDPWGREDLVYHVHVLVTVTSGTPVSLECVVSTDTHTEPNVANELGYYGHILNFTFLLRHTFGEIIHATITPHGADADFDTTITVAYAGPWFGSAD